MEKLEGIADIRTDIVKRTCTFRVKNADADLKAKLEELAKTNSHMQELQIVEGFN